MAYRAEIQIGVKGIKDLRNAQAKIERLSRQVDEANKKPLFNKAVVANLQTYNAVLAKANRTLNKTQIELDGAGNAVNKYKKAINNVVIAQADANEASKITNKLLKEEVANRNAATTAIRSQVEANIRLSRESREASNFSLNFDPATTKSIARRRRKLAGDPSSYAAPAGPVPSELQGQSSLVEQRIQRQIAGNSDLLKVKKALEAQEQRTVSLLEEKLNITRRVTNLSESQKGLNSEKQRLNVLRGTGDVQEALFKLNQRSNSLLEEKLNITRKVVNATREERLEAERLKGLRTSEPRVSLRAQERPLFVQEKIELGRSQRIARESSGALRTSRAEGLAKAAIQAGKLAQAEALSELKTKEIKQNLSGSRINLEAMVVANNNMLPALKQAVELAEQQLKISKQGALTAGRFSPVQGSQSTQGSPLFLQAQRKRRQDAVSSGIIGGAFPLLFGQGPAAAVGGGLGGFGGGLAGGQLGFGLSLVGTQIGAAVDQVITSITTLSSSLREPTAALAALGDAGIKVNSSVALQIQQLESAGKAYEAQALLLDTVAEKLGVDAVAQLQALDKAQEQTQQHISDFKSALTAELLPALTLAAQGINVLAGTLTKLSNIKIPIPGGEDVTLDIPKIIRNTAFGQLLPGGPGLAQVASQGLSMLPKPELQAPELTPTQKLAQQTKQLKATTGIGSSRLENEITELIGKNLKRNNDLTDATVVANKRLIISKTAQNKENKLSASIEEKRLNKAMTTDVLTKEGLERDKIRNEASNQHLQLTNSVNAAQEKAAGTQERKTKSAERQLKAEQKKLERAAEVTRLLSIGADLTEYTTGQDKAIADALRDGNKALAYKLQIARELTILDFERNKIQNQTTSAVDKNLKTRIAEAKTLGRLGALEGSRLDSIKKAKETFEQQLSKVEDEINLSKARLEGRLEEEKIDQAINNLKKENTEIGDVELNQLRQKLELLNNQKSLEEAFNIQQKTKFAGAGLQAGFIGQAGKAFEGKRQEGASIEDATKIANLTQEMELAQAQAQALESAVLGIGNAFATAMTTGVSELIAGTKSAQEVFADFLKNIGDALVSAATQMIATYIAIGIAKAFAGMGSSGGGGVGKLPENPLDSFKAAGVQGPIYDFQAKANGGPVSGGQPYMVGERGPELFVPGQSGGVMRNEDMRSLMGRSPASGGAASMNFSFETTSIGGTEYVSREQLESAMAVTRKQASNDGAKRGMSMTLDKMQNSPRTRSKIGLR